MYGGWITPDGEWIDVPEQCQHERYVCRLDANDEGYIAVVFGSDNTAMYFRFNPKTVTKAALIEMKKQMKDSRRISFHFSDMFMEDFKGHSRSKKLSDANKFVNEIMKGDLKLYRRWD